jgi:hypothetical protein
MHSETILACSSRSTAALGSSRSNRFGAVLRLPKLGLRLSGALKKSADDVAAAGQL